MKRILICQAAFLAVPFLMVALGVWYAPYSRAPFLTIGMVISLFIMFEARAALDLSKTVRIEVERSLFPAIALVIIFEFVALMIYKMFVMQV